MLDKVQFKLTYSQISGFILEKEYTNFITLQQVISDLQDSELIKADTLMNRTYFSITPEGQNTLAYFGNRIGEAIINDIDAFLAENHLELKNEASIMANCYKATSGEYEAELIAREKDDFSDSLLKRKMRYVGVEALFVTEEAPICQPEYLQAMNDKGLVTWANSIVYNYKAVLSAGHTDDVAVSEDPDYGWGWLLDRGFRIIQTDWPLALKQYLQSRKG